MTYEAVRQKRIRCFDWQYASEYLTDFLNLFRTPAEASSNGGGATTFVYRSHPSKPNDTLMAINYAYMLGKILLGEAMFADSSLNWTVKRSCGDVQIKGVTIAAAGWTDFGGQEFLEDCALR
jgi:hypothetical protein